jgi:3-deoxy-manno-octulosonate cytidylyltransferase (CMP-KDO synthetase)
VHRFASAPPQATVVAAIPARYGSTRLPGKPLASIAGRPLIEHVYERTAAAPAVDRVVVLTDDERVGRAVEAFGGRWELTPADCPSGTDRIAWAARGWDCQAVVNVQGDWILDPELIGTLARHLAAHPEDPMATLAVPARPGDEAQPSVVKVVADLAGRALYFSRAGIPFRRQPGGPPSLRHLGIYGYRRETLLHLASLPPTPLETAESLEQLRALEHGVPIRVLVVEGDALGVDTPDDLARAEAALAGGREPEPRRLTAETR